MSEKRPVLSIVIPALNEEEAIGQTLQRCLDALPEIQSRGQVGEIEIIVVNDGSTDRTPELAQEFVDRHPQFRLINFANNRGYGAAIKEGFCQSQGDLVSFLDADGTCDPRFFGNLCAALQAEHADVALGNRMTAESHMPLVRRVGNRLFAILLGLLSGQAVSDTASGMRVLRREALQNLYPLPDGLDFTPAMSARAILQETPIIEVPMSYSERIGESKLRAVKDGIRFLRAIFDAVLFFQPARLFLLGFFFCLVLLVALAIGPAEYYFQNGFLEDYMIYRFLTCLLLGSAGFTLLCSGVVAYDLQSLKSRRGKRESFWKRILDRLFSKWMLLSLSVIALGMAFFLIWPGLVEYFSTRHVTLHWSRVIVAASGFFTVIQCITTASLRRIVALWSHYLNNGTVLGKTERLPLSDRVNSPRQELEQSVPM